MVLSSFGRCLLQPQVPGLPFEFPCSPLNALGEVVNPSPSSVPLRQTPSTPSHHKKMRGSCSESGRGAAKKVTAGCHSAMTGCHSRNPNTALRLFPTASHPEADQAPASARASSRMPQCRRLTHFTFNNPSPSNTCQRSWLP